MKRMLSRVGKGAQCRELALVLAVSMRAVPTRHRSGPCRPRTRGHGATIGRSLGGAITGRLCPPYSARIPVTP
jgi:hypothetical protein